MLYQVPVYAAEECVRLDIGESRLWPAAEPLFGVLGVRVQIRTSQCGAKKPRFEARGHPASFPRDVKSFTASPAAGLSHQRKSRVTFTEFLMGLISHYVSASMTTD